MKLLLCSPVEQAKKRLCELNMASNLGSVGWFAALSRLCWQSFSKVSIKLRFLLQDHPDLVKDQFWDEDRPEMPYTLASEEIKLRHVPAADSTALFEVRS